MVRMLRLVVMTSKESCVCLRGALHGWVACEVEVLVQFGSLILLSICCRTAATVCLLNRITRKLK